MDKQAQDKIWDELSEESKKFVKSLYYDVKDPNRELYDYEDRAQKELLESIYGEHNLNPKPQIKTWEDIEKYNINWSNVDIDRLNSLDAITPKMRNKLIATYKIAKLIELGYGGMVSEEEWKDAIEIWYIDFDKDKNPLVCLRGLADSNKICPFIAFRTKQQAEEFMSYESNRRLVEQYFMM